MASHLHADWKDEIGFTRLQSLVGPELPAAPTEGFTQAEAFEAANYAPDLSGTAFTGKLPSLKSGPSGTSSHAQQVATFFYSNTSLLPGASPVDLYSADGWLHAGFLHYGETIVPVTEARTVQNHSWIGDNNDAEVNQRLDYAINRDGFVCVVGENNGNSTTLPGLLGQSYHTISVGLVNGGHSAGFTTYDGPGRIKPDLVAPEGLTSWATPMVAGAAGLLYAKLEAAPYTLAGADMPRVIKALLLASATKNTVPSWSNTSTRPLDLRYGAGELNIHHSYSTVSAPRATASDITQYKLRSWAAESIDENSSKTYFFTIPAGAPSTPFSAALTWHRDVQTAVSGHGILKKRTWSTTLANLNLHLYQANGLTKGNLIAESLSSLDNVELIHQPALPPGDYAIVVENSPSTTAPSPTPYALAWHSLPAVTIAATAHAAREIDGQAGQFTLTRTGDTTLPLYVPLSVGGTAVAGTHYQALPASLTIPAGQTTTIFQVTPISDSLAQGNRTVTVSVAADFALVSDAAQAAVVTIEDKPFDAWRFANFTTPELTNPAISGGTADPDADDLANLIEYALNLAPKSQDISPVSMLDLDGYLAITTRKNTAATDITWGAEITGTLELWNPAVVTTNNSITFAARDNVPKTAATQRFIRLKITRP